jgi:uncharacterized repeat protein (TIGR03803 family)
MTYAGGVNGAGTVLKITPAGVETVIWSFANGADGDEPYGSLVQGSDGNFYGMTYAGGVNSAGTVFKTTPGGVETVLWSFGTGTDGSYPYGSLVQGNDGNFYGVTYYGGTISSGTIFQITPGGAETVLYSFLGSSSNQTDGRYPEGSLSFGPDGTMYGFTFGEGTDTEGMVFIFN